MWLVRQSGDLVTDFFNAQAPPLNLAVFRMLVCAALLFHVPRAADYLSLPETLLQVPLGSEIVFGLMPKSQSGSDVLWWVFTISCLCGLIGWHARAALAVATATGLFVYGLPQFFGKIDHSHHLLWFALVLASSPCGDALSVDQWLASGSGRAPVADRAPAQKYALPLRIVWLLIGLIYLFSGAWKLLAVGWDWALGDNIKYTVHHKWFDLGGYQPPFRIDAYPTLYRSLGLGALGFELGFIVAIFLAPLRRVFVVVGLAFHAFIYFFLDIRLYGLAWCYAAFIDWERLWRRLRGPDERTPLAFAPRVDAGSSTGDTLPVRVAGATLIVGVVLAGMMHLSSWPFAVYPTFAVEYGPRVATLRVDAISVAGRITIERAVLYRVFVTPMRWRLAQYRALLAETEEARRRQCEALRALFTERLAQLRTADQVELRQVVQWVDPARQEEPPIADELFCSWQVGADADQAVSVSDKWVDVRSAIPALHRIYVRDASLIERMREAMESILGLAAFRSTRRSPWQPATSTMGA
jgi:hypothetical protein